MKSNRLAFASALGLCLLALFMLNGVKGDIGVLNAPNTNSVTFSPVEYSTYPADRVDPDIDLIFYINVSWKDSTSLDELVVFFGNGVEVSLDVADIPPTACTDCGWNMDNPNDGNYATNMTPDTIDAGTVVVSMGAETIEYGFKAKFDGSTEWNAFWPGGLGDTNDSGVRVNTLPVLTDNALVSPAVGMPYDTFSVSVTYTDADNHTGTVNGVVCETNNLSNCESSFPLSTPDDDSTDGAVYSGTFSTTFGGDLTVVLNASDGTDFALLDRSTTFEVDTDKPWLINNEVSATNAGENDNITFSVVYCVFDVTGSGAITVNVDIAGTTHAMVADGSNDGACLNGINMTVTKTVAWSLDEQIVTFSASNANDTAENVVHSSTITINDAPTLSNGTAERVGDNFVINVTAADINAGDSITVNATIQYGSTYVMDFDGVTGNYTVTVSQASIQSERGGTRVVTFETTDLHQTPTNENFANAVTIDVDKTSSFTLATSSNAVTLAPGVHILTFTIDNNGNSADGFDISTSSVNSWITSAPSEVLVDYDSDEDFTITVTVPEVAEGTIDSWTVTAVAQNDNSQSNEEAGTTTVDAISSHTVTGGAATGSGDPGSSVKYYFTITNTGNAEETFAYSTSSTDGWTTTGSGSVVIAMGNSQTIEVSHNIDSNAGASDTATITFASGSESASAVTSANQLYLLSASQTGTTENIGNVKPGDSINVQFTVTNGGNGADTVSVSFYGDWLSGNSDTTDSISSLGSGVYSASIVVPKTAASGSSSPVSISVVGSGDSSDDTTYTINVAASTRSASVTGTDSYTFNKGTSGAGTVTVENTGVEATFTVVSMSPSLSFAISEITLLGGASGDMSFTMTAEVTGSAVFRIEDAIDGSFDEFTLSITAREFSTDMSAWGLGECSKTGAVCTYDMSSWSGIAYTKAGIWTTTMVYTDANGQTGTHTIYTTIENTKPTLNAPSLSNSVEGTEQTFIFTIPTDSDGSISHFVIEFGDGESVTFQASDLEGKTKVTAKHTYAITGPVTVKATAYDNSGGSTAQEVAMTVNDRTVALDGSSYVYNLIALVGFFLLGILLAGTAFKMQKGEIAGDEEMNERDRQRLESVERRMEGLSEREELLEVSAYDASRAATKLEEHISAFNGILVQAQEIAAKEKLEELEAAEQAQQEVDEQTQLDLDDPDIEMVAERFHSALGRLVTAREELSKIEEQLAHILKMERDEQLEKLTEMTESYETTKRKIDALSSSKEARDAAAVENNITNLLSAAASGGSLSGADFGDFGDDSDDEYEVEIYEDEDGSFYYIDPDTGEEVPCDEDGNAL